MRSTFEQLEQQILNPNLTLEERKKKADEFAVQSKKEAERIQEIENNRGALSSTAFLEIAGISENGPQNGRYLGIDELVNLLTEVVSSHGGSVRRDRPHDEVRIRLTKSLSMALNDLAAKHARASAAVRKIQQRAFTGDELVLATTSDRAERERIDLLSAVHPLIALAVEERRQRREEQSWFGRLAVSGFPGRAFIASVDYVESSGGLIEFRELWITAVDAHTGEVVDGVGDAVFTALADGALSPSAVAPPEGLIEKFAATTQVVDARHMAARTRLRAENDAMVTARVASFRDSIGRKIARARETVETLAARGNDESRSILPMHQARLARREFEAQTVDEQFEKRRNLIVVREQVAALLIEGI